MKQERECPTCHHKYEVDACEKCNGRGTLFEYREARGFSICTSMTPCPDCDGTGIVGGKVIVTI